jgi:Tfp pilus assembly protein PilF
MLLLEQARYESAESELHQALAEDPDDAMAHTVLALCLAKREKYDEATREVDVAMGLSPDQPFVFYARSCILTDRNCFPEAEAAIQEAIGLDPYQPEYFAQLARVQFEQRRWAAALAAAEQGLELDAEDVTCTNLRAMALVKLGRRMEAGEAITSALRREPEDADTHANMGWSLLENAQPQQALEHFREALRLNPNSDWARQGIVEAMKARYFVYRLILGWFLWMLKLSGSAQWGILVGAFVGYQVLRSIARSNPTLAPWITPVLIAYVVFAIMTWVASPLFDLMLRLNRFGRLALSREQIITSNWVGLCVLGAVLSLAGYFLSGNGIWLICALAGGFMIPLVSRIYACHVGWPRNTLIAMTIVMAVLGIVVIGLALLEPWIPLELRPYALAAARLALTLFMIGAIAGQFAVNALVQVRPRRG